MLTRLRQDYNMGHRFDHKQALILTTPAVAMDVIKHAKPAGAPQAPAGLGISEVEGEAGRIRPRLAFAEWRWLLPGVLLFELSQVTHQAALPAGGVVLMQNTLFSGLIQGADGSQGRLASGNQIAAFHCQAGFLDGRARLAYIEAVAQAALFILLVALDGRFNVSQNLPPKK
jgi:hypothetical protein